SFFKKRIVNCNTSARKTADVSLLWIYCNIWFLNINYLRHSVPIVKLVLHARVQSISCIFLAARIICIKACVVIFIIQFHTFYIALRGIVAEEKPCIIGTADFEIAIKFAQD